MIVIKPKGHVAVCTLVDFNRSKAGLELPTSNLKGVTYGGKVVEIGDLFDTTRCNVGDTIMYRTANQAFFRNGQSFLIVKDEDVLGIISYDPEDIGAQPNETLKLPPKDGEAKAAGAST